MGTLATVLAGRKIPTFSDRYRADVEGDIDGVLKIKSANRLRVIQRGHRSRKVVRRVQALHAEGGFWQSNPLDPALQNPSKRVAGLKQCELDAR